MVHISELIRFEMDLIQREKTTSSKNEIIKILQRKMNTQNNPI